MVEKIVFILIMSVAVFITVKIIYSWFIDGLNTGAILEWVLRGYFFGMGLLATMPLFFMITKVFKSW